jgi:hypothetical protein
MVINMASKSVPYVATKAITTIQEYHDAVQDILTRMYSDLSKVELGEFDRKEVLSCIGVMQDSQRELDGVTQSMSPEMAAKVETLSYASLSKLNSLERSMTQANGGTKPSDGELRKALQASSNFNTDEKALADLEISSKPMKTALAVYTSIMIMDFELTDEAKEEIREMLGIKQGGSGSMLRK